MKESSAGVVLFVILMPQGSLVKVRSPKGQTISALSLLISQESSALYQDSTDWLTMIFLNFGHLFAE